MDNANLISKLAYLPEPDFLHATKLDAPLGSNTSYRASTVVSLIEQAVAAERERCAMICDEVAKNRGQEVGHVADECATLIRA